MVEGKDGKAVIEPSKNVLTPSPENKWGVWISGSGEFVNVSGDGNGKEWWVAYEFHLWRIQLRSGPMPSDGYGRLVRRRRIFLRGIFVLRFFILAGMSKTLRLPNCDEQALLDQVQVRLVERAELERFKQLLDEHHYLGGLKAVGQRLH